MKFLIIFLIGLILASCIPQSEYVKLEKDYQKNARALDKLKKQIVQLKNQLASQEDTLRRLQTEVTFYKDSFYLTKNRLTENVEKLFEKINLKDKHLHTAIYEHYLIYEEKNAFYWLNLARTQPQYYCKMYVEKLAEQNSKNFYYTTLYETLMNMQPVQMLYPNRYLFHAAECHAITHGEKGYLGHKRTEECEKYKFYAENCAYGYYKGFNVILGLLVDENVPSLGHRENFLNGKHSIMGVAVAEHNSEYNICWVFDLAWLKK